MPRRPVSTVFSFAQQHARRGGYPGVCRVIALLWLLVGLPAAAEAQLDLRWNFQPGQAWRVVVKSEYDSTVGTTLASTETRRSQADWRADVLAVSETGTATLRVWLEHVRWSFESPHRESLVYNTAEDQDLPDPWSVVPRLWRWLKRIRCEIEIEPNGDVTRVTLEPGFLNATHEYLRRQGLSLADYELHETFTEINQALWVKLPAQVVQAGDSWSQQQWGFTSSGGASWASDYKGHYVGSVDCEGEKLEKIDLQRQESQPARLSPPVAGFETNDLHVENSQVIYFDAAVGAPVKYVMLGVTSQQHRQRTYYVERQTVDREQISYELLTR